MPQTTLQIPDDISAEMDHLDLTVEGPEGSVSRRLWYPDVSVSVDDGEIVIESDDGVTEGWEYELEVFYSHFPMQVEVEGDEVRIENFLGERAPRRTTVHGDTEVEVDSETVTVSGPDIEAVGQTAADIEQLTRVQDKDVRVFQDGVYITGKPNRGGA
ncbi:50S ribosomal protein L6 [Halobacteriales archaeon QH_3_68_24]|nr:MAG: 50S ribosomal protein L6 [Halobacteriales archaeon QH_3_68_24]